MLTEDVAPDFTLPDQNGDAVTLSDLRGQTVVPCTSTPARTRNGIKTVRREKRGA